MAMTMSEPNIVASLVHKISSHTSDINGVCFSKDRKLATCSGDKSVRLWDTNDFSELPCSPLCGHTYYVHCCTFSPFGTLLATCSTDGKTIIWDTKSGTKAAVLQHESKCPIRVCRFSPDSAFIVTGSDDNNLCLWDMQTKKYIRSLQGHEATVFGCDFTPDSQFIVSGSSDGDLQVWDTRYGHSKALTMVLEGHDLGVTCCEFSPTFGAGQDPSMQNVHFLLATSGQDDLVKLWDFHAESGSSKVSLTMKQCLSGHDGSVMQCRFSLNGALLASASIDKTVKLWNPLNGALLHSIEGHTRYVTCCAFSSDGQLLASGSNDKTVMVWKLTTDIQLISTLEDVEANFFESSETNMEGVPKSRKRPEVWSVEEVAQWLTEIGLGQYEENFTKNHIDGQELLTLTQESLQIAIGIEAFGHRNKILRCRTQLMQHPVVQQKDMDAGIPDEYLCPITREIMKDPVMCSDGYTYERSAIVGWMNRGKDRSPMTNAVLTHKDMTPNRSLKMLIQKYLNPT